MPYQERKKTCSAIRPLLQHVIEICEAKDDISADLCPRFESAGISLIIDKCSFLDPRFNCKVHYVADTDLVKCNLLTEMLEQL